jgi:putative salt-induced outer membrane protein
MKIYSLGLCAALISAQAIAEEEKSLALDAELGIISTSGNTETSSLKGKIDIKQDLTRFRNHFVAEAFYKKDQIDAEVDGETISTNQTTAEKYFLSGQTDFKLDSEHKGLFLFGSYEDDRFSGYEYQATLAIGFSDRLFNFENSHLDYSVGPGMSFNKTEAYIDENDVLIESETSETAVLRLSASYLLQLSENAKFTQSLSSDASLEGGKNTKTKAESALTANLTKSFALKASYSITHNTHVPADKKHADSQTALTFVYSY